MALAENEIAAENRSRHACGAGLNHDLKTLNPPASRMSEITDFASESTPATFWRTLRRAV
jgi:hypothetical protein